MSEEQCEPPASGFRNLMIRWLIAVPAACGGTQVYFEFLHRASHAAPHSIKPRSPVKLRAERLGSAGAFVCLFVLTVCMYTLLPAKVVSTRRGKRRRLRGALSPAHKRRWSADGARGNGWNTKADCAQSAHDTFKGFDHVATPAGDKKQLTFDAAPTLEAMPQVSCLCLQLSGRACMCTLWSLLCYIWHAYSSMFIGVISWRFVSGAGQNRSPHHASVKSACTIGR